MKFNVELSGLDLKNQKEIMESVFTTQMDDGVQSIDSASVCKSMKIFVKTFTKEICPICGEGVLNANHLSYYNKIVKRCDICDYQVT